MKYLLILLPILSVLAIDKPDFAHARSSRSNQNDGGAASAAYSEGVCRDKIAPKHLSKANEKIELDKCLESPDSYQ